MCHDWLEQLPEAEREKVNNELREYKKSIKLGIAEVTTEGIKQVQVVELPTTEEYIEIPLEPMTAEELRIYEEHKRKRNEKVFKRFGVEYKKPKQMTPEQLRQQRELQEDLLREIRY